MFLFIFCLLLAIVALVMEWTVAAVVDKFFARCRALVWMPFVVVVFAAGALFVATPTGVAAFPLPHDAPCHEQHGGSNNCYDDGVLHNFDKLSD